MTTKTFIERAVLQGVGFALLYKGQQVAVGYQCIGEQAWSIRVSGARFEMDAGRRFLASRGRIYDEMTYVQTKADAVAIAVLSLENRRNIRPISAIYQAGLAMV